MTVTAKNNIEGFKVTISGDLYETVVTAPDKVRATMMQSMLWTLRVSSHSSDN